MPTRRKDRPSKPDGLTKQTYSVTVHLPGSSENRKWHLVAYFSVWKMVFVCNVPSDLIIMNLKGNDYQRLPIIENYQYLRNIHVPHGVFLSNKVVGARTDPSRFSHFSEESDVHDDATPLDGLPTHSYFESRGASSSIGHSVPPPSYLTLSPPYLPATSRNTENQRIPLPPITALGHPMRRPPLSPSHASSLSCPNYMPLSSEDRRVLDRFRVTL